jgi:hypothetical protein
VERRENQAPPLQVLATVEQQRPALAEHGDEGPVGLARAQLLRRRGEDLLDQHRVADEDEATNPGEADRETSPYSRRVRFMKSVGRAIQRAT